MGIKSLFGFGQARDKPVRNYSNGEYTFNFGRSTSGKSVNEMTAMQTTTVYACVRILSEAIASLPIHVYRYKDGEKEMVCDHPLYTLLHDEPSFNLGKCVCTDHTKWERRGAFSVSASSKQDEVWRGTVMECCIMCILVIQMRIPT